MLQFVQSPSHLSHITLSQPFRIKCERYIFLKKCVRSSLLLILFPPVWLYMVVTMQQSIESARNGRFFLRSR